jgi:hypothetical protein
MKILQVSETRKMLEAYQDGHITIEELTEDLECYRDRKIYKGTKTPVPNEEGIRMNAIKKGE